MSGASAKSLQAGVGRRRTGFRGENGPIPARVLIVDDHARFRALARRILESSGWTVVAEAADGAYALREAERVSPDLVLLDVGLPDISGLELAKTLCGSFPALDVVLVSTHDAADYADLVAATGARGFLTKADLSSEALQRLLGNRMTPGARPGEAGREG